jgi:hypothetical protein
MTLHTLPTDDEPNGYDDHTEMISQARGQVLTELAAGLKALQRAAAGVAELRSNAVHDIELVDGRDGRDLATFIDDSIRFGRAAYAVMHAIIDKETP